MLLYEFTEICGPGGDVMGLALPEVREKGWQALIEALGYAGATNFILLSEKGRGAILRKEGIFSEEQQ